MKQSIFRWLNQAAERQNIAQRLLSAMFTSGIRQHESPGNSQLQCVPGSCSCSCSNQVESAGKALSPARCKDGSSCIGRCASEASDTKKATTSKGSWDEQYIKWLEDGDMTLATSLRQEIAGRLRELSDQKHEKLVDVGANDDWDDLEAEDAADEAAA